MRECGEGSRGFSGLWLSCPTQQVAFTMQTISGVISSVGQSITCSLLISICSILPPLQVASYVKNYRNKKDVSRYFWSQAMFIFQYLEVVCSCETLQAFPCIKFQHHFQRQENTGFSFQRSCDILLQCKQKEMRIEGQIFFPSACQAGRVCPQIKVID